jgi:SAM-dependent methyltransferase
MGEIFLERGLSVDLYDRMYPTALPGSAVQGDVAFYLAQSRRVKGPILELAVGTGRVALPLLRARHAVTGLDLSPSMLRVCRRKAEALGLDRHLTLVRANMTRFDLGKQFDLILVPFRAFMHLFTPADQRACLLRVRKHLKPGGRFILDIFDPLLELCSPKYTLGGGRPGDSREDTYPDPETGTTGIVRYLSRQNDPLTQILREVWEFELRDARGRTMRRERQSVTLRWTYRWEMRYLLELAGLKPVACYGDFRAGPPRYGAEQIWISERPR